MVWSRISVIGSLAAPEFSAGSWIYMLPRSGRVGAQLLACSFALVGLSLAAVTLFRMRKRRDTWIFTAGMAGAGCNALLATGFIAQLIGMA